MKARDPSVKEFIASIEPERRRGEARDLDALFRKATGFQPKLWSGRMIGYGEYSYVYKSGHKGTWLATGFAISSRQITICILPGYTSFRGIMARLGPHTMGKSCLYLRRLDKIDQGALVDLILAGLAELETCWPVKPT